MKRSILAAALVMSGALMGSAQATEVGLRGAIDLGLTVSHTTNGTTLSETANNYVGSEVTLFGEENLANNNVVGFNLTAGFNPDDGRFDSEEARMFNHESQVYLKGDWGQFGMGRMSSFATGLGTQSWLVQFDAFEAAFADAGLHASQQSIFARYSNSLYYASPEMGGVRVGLFYSMTGDESDVEAAHVQDNERYWNVATRWDNDRFGVLLSLEGTERSNLDSMKDGLVFKLAAKANLGPVTMMGGYSHAEHQEDYAFGTWAANAIYRMDDGIEKTSGIRSDAAYVGMQIPFGHSQFNAQYQYLDGRNTDTQTDFKRHVVAAGVYHYLSQRTMLYGVVSWSKGTGALSKTIDPDSNASNLHIGMTHFF